MFRRLLIVVALAGLAASCSNSDVLATVNGEEITRDDLAGLRPGYDESDSAVTGEELREDVSGLIVLSATMQAAEEDFGLVFDDATIQERLDNPPERYSQLLDPALAAANPDDQTQRTRAIVTLLVDGVGPAIVAQEEGGYEALYTNRPDIVSRVCVRHIAVATAEEGEVVLDRLAAGESFVDLVAELSLDTASPAGLLLDSTGECPTWLSGIGGEFSLLTATADLNVPVGPIDTGSGFSVFQVEERIKPASAAELEADPMEYLELAIVSTLYSTWASDAVRDADIDVSSALGRWSSAGFGIAPPGE